MTELVETYKGVKIYKLPNIPIWYFKTIKGEPDRHISLENCRIFIDRDKELRERRKREAEYRKTPEYKEKMKEYKENERLRKIKRRDIRREIKDIMKKYRVSEEDIVRFMEWEYLLYEDS